METVITQLVTIIDVFAGCLLAIVVRDLFKPKPKQVEKQVIRRVVPVNYGKFADPIGEYEQFKDERTNLYTSYVPKKKSRRGEVSE